MHMAEDNKNQNSDGGNVVLDGFTEKGKQSLADMLSLQMDSIVSTVQAIGQNNNKEQIPPNVEFLDTTLSKALEQNSELNSALLEHIASTVSDAILNTGLVDAINGLNETKAKNNSDIKQDDTLMNEILAFHNDINQGISNMDDHIQTQNIDVHVDSKPLSDIDSETKEDDTEVSEHPIENIVDTKLFDLMNSAVESLSKISEQNKSIEVPDNSEIISLLNGIANSNNEFKELIGKGLSINDLDKITDAISNVTTNIDALSNLASTNDTIDLSDVLSNIAITNDTLNELKTYVNELPKGNDLLSEMSSFKDIIGSMQMNKPEDTTDTVVNELQSIKSTVDDVDSNVASGNELAVNNVEANKNVENIVSDIKSLNDDMSNIDDNQITEEFLRSEFDVIGNAVAGLTPNLQDLLSQLTVDKTTDLLSPILNGDEDRVSANNIIEYPNNPSSLQSVVQESDSFNEYPNNVADFPTFEKQTVMSLPTGDSQPYVDVQKTDVTVDSPNDVDRLKETEQHIQNIQNQTEQTTLNEIAMMAEKSSTIPTDTTVKSSEHIALSENEIKSLAEAIGESVAKHLSGSILSEDRIVAMNDEMMRQLGQTLKG